MCTVRIPTVVAGYGIAAQATAPHRVSPFSITSSELTRTSCNKNFVCYDFLDFGSRLMKNVTITMEESVADWARMEAARRNTSVSRLVGELAAEKMRHDDAYERAMREVLEFRSFGASDGHYLSRDEMYDRSANRGAR